MTREYEHNDAQIAYNTFYHNMQRTLKTPNSDGKFVEAVFKSLNQLEKQIYDFETRSENNMNDSSLDIPPSEKLALSYVASFDAIHSFAEQGYFASSERFFETKIESQMNYLKALGKPLEDLEKLVEGMRVTRK
jgi:hypothetical protein